MDKLESELKKWLTNKFKGERKEKYKIRVPISQILRDSGGGPTAPEAQVPGGGVPRPREALVPGESLKMWRIGTLSLYFFFSWRGDLVFQRIFTLFFA